MNRKTILAALMLCACLTARSSAITVDFTLTIDVSTNTWTLSGATDAIGGIGAFAVELGNIPSGTSVAPRSVFDNLPVRGFTVGNNFSEYPQPSPPANSYQLFAGQNPLNLESLVYQIGYAPVSPAAFGVDGVSPLSMVGDASIVPTPLYIGTYNPAGPLPVFRSEQPNPSVSVYLALPPPGGYDRPTLPDGVIYSVETVTFNTLIVPEPSAGVLSPIAVLFLGALARRRRSLSKT